MGRTVDIDTDRHAAVLDIIEETDRKLIVFVPFVHSVKSLTEYLTTNKIPAAHVYGQTPKRERDSIFRAFQQETEPKVLVAQPAAMSHGLTLTEANTIIWYSPVPSFEIYEQANGRIKRASQKHKMYIINMWGSNVEKKIYKTLNKRGNMMADLLGLFEELRLEFSK